MSVFRKERADAPDGFFAWEAAGLAWLAVRSGPPVVEVLGEVGPRDRAIRLARLTPVRATPAAAEALGVGLAGLHATGASGFGRPPEGWDLPHGWIGRQVLPLAPADQAPTSWGAFYAELRLRPSLRAARDRGRFDADDVALVERVCARLEAGEWDDGRPPARIHGDLWGGNVVHTAEGATLIDPAAHGGHGETDLAMLALFGTEHLERVQTAYAEAAGLDAGWPDRVPLHQLHPVLVHAVSHGPSYAAQALAIARRYA